LLSTKIPADPPEPNQILELNISVHYNTKPDIKAITNNEGQCSQHRIYDELKPGDRRSGRSRKAGFLQYLFGGHVQLGEPRTSKREFTYLDVRLELANLMEAAQDGERAAFEEVAQHCIVRERAVEGRLADGRYLEL
jgi:hypothetical protein